MSNISKCKQGTFLAQCMEVGHASSFLPPTRPHIGEDMIVIVKVMEALGKRHLASAKKALCAFSASFLIFKVVVWDFEKKKEKILITVSIA